MLVPGDRLRRPALPQHPAMHLPSPASSAIRVILDDVMMPNAFAVGPDGQLYFPVMGANEIWRIDLAGGTPGWSQRISACPTA